MSMFLNFEATRRAMAIRWSWVLPRCLTWNIMKRTPKYAGKLLNDRLRKLRKLCWSLQAADEALLSCGRCVRVARPDRARRAMITFVDEESGMSNRSPGIAKWCQDDSQDDAKIIKEGNKWSKNMQKQRSKATKARIQYHFEDAKTVDVLYPKPSSSSKQELFLMLKLQGLAQTHSRPGPKMSKVYMPLL